MLEARLTRSPLTDEMLTPMEPDREFLIIGGELADSEYRRVARLLEEHPWDPAAGVLRRGSDPEETGIAGTWPRRSESRHMINLRRLWIETPNGRTGAASIPPDHSRITRIPGPRRL